MKNLWTFFLAITLNLFSENFTSRESLEALVKDFLLAVHQKNKEKILSLCTYEENMEILWKKNKISKEENSKLEKEIKNATIHWFKVGDEIRFGRIKYKANNFMINKNRKVVLAKVKRFASPIQLTKINKQWKIQPYWLILNEKARIKQEAQSGQFSHVLEINGIPYSINLNKGQTIELANGEKLFIKLKETPLKMYNSKDINFSYSNQLYLREYKRKKAISVVLTSKLSNRIVIEISKNPKKSETLIKETMDSFIKSYQSLNLPVIKDNNKRIFKIIAQEKVFGQKIYTKMNKTDTQVDSFFCFKKSGKVIFISYHCLLKDIDLMDTYFSVIQETLMIKKDKLPKNLEKKSN